MEQKKKILYSQYGKGEELLFAFHGYGMDGCQFRILEQSLNRRYHIIGFHLPYHNNGPSGHQNWITGVKAEIKKILIQHKTENFSLAGYSVGSKVSLSLMEEFQHQLKEIYLFAPYGLENHWGLSFVTQSLGNAFFRLIVNTSIPEKIMKLVKFLRIIDEEHHQIIHRELLSKNKRKSLCKTLKMAGELKITTEKLPEILNVNDIKCTIIYGKDDVLFPYNKRNTGILNQLNSSYVDEISEGHWMVTRKLDQALANNFAL